MPGIASFSLIKRSTVIEYHVQIQIASHPKVGPLCILSVTDMPVYPVVIRTRGQYDPIDAVRPTLHLQFFGAINVLQSGDIKIDGGRICRIDTS